MSMLVVFAKKPIRISPCLSKLTACQGWHVLRNNVQGAEKMYPSRFLVVFSAIARNFKVKFYRHIFSRPMRT